MKTEGTRKKICQNIFTRAKAFIKEDTCMKSYDEMSLLHLETDASVIGQGVGLLQVRYGMDCPYAEEADNTILRPIAFDSKCLFAMEI